MRSVTDRRPPNRSDLRREALLDALDRCLQETSLDVVNVAEISRLAGVTRSAFYFYFENKASAVAALMERAFADAFVVTGEFTTTTAPADARIRAMVGGVLETWDRHRHLFRAMLEARGHSDAVREIWDRARESFVGAVATMIRDERSAGRAPDGLDAVVLASVLLELNDRLLERLTLGGPLSREQLAAGAETVWLRTIYGTGSPAEDFT